MVLKEEDMDRSRELGRTLNAVKKLLADVEQVNHRAALLQVPLGLQLVEGPVRISYKTFSSRQQRMLN